VNVLLLIRSLDPGGAERQLVVLAKGLRERGHYVTVVVFYAGGAMQMELAQAGITVHDLRKRGRWELVRFFLRLHGLVRRVRPEVLYAFLQLPNLLSVLLKVLHPTLRVIWGVRASNMDLAQYDRVTGFAYWLESRFAPFADHIIANSHAGAAVALSKGFPSQKLVVVPNAIDAERFAPDARARGRVRSEWEVDGEAFLIGLVGRLDPMKDHETFLKAAALLARERPDIRFACIGDGPPAYQSRLQTLTADLALEGKVLWLPAQQDMPAVFNALDILTSASSYGEGFSNVIGEAMACGIPCVVTDVGDSAWIVGDAERVVSPRDPEALCRALIKVLDLSVEEQARLGENARLRVQRKFSVERLVSETEACLLHLA